MDRAESLPELCAKFTPHGVRRAHGMECRQPPSFLRNSQVPVGQTGGSGAG
jgi:hypothetical protein